MTSFKCGKRRARSSGGKASSKRFSWGDGGLKHAYQVSARRTYNKYALPRSVFTGAPLVLITCGGPFDEEHGRYRDNIVVYATPS